jgi:hypothetical protein
MGKSFNQQEGGMADPSNTQGKGAVPGTPGAIPTVDAKGIALPEGDALGSEGAVVNPQPTRTYAPELTAAPTTLPGQPSGDVAGG